MKKFPRRHFLHLATGAAALPAVSRLTWAQAYPARPVRLIVGFAPGGPADILARLIGQRLAEQLGQPFVIENRLGAGSSVAAETVAKAAPDGYTLLLVSSAHAVNASFYEKLNFNFIRDIAPVAGIDQEPLVMLVRPSLPIRTVPEFIAYAKTNAGKLNMGSAGNGTLTHVAGELFKMMAGINLLHVPYRGGAPALTELIAGRVHVVFNPMVGTVDHIRAATLRALAVTTMTRSETLPDLPSVRDFLPGYESSVWFGIGAPRNTPAEIVDKLNKQINAALGDLKIRTMLADWGGVPLALSPAGFGKLIADETEKWAKVVKFASIKPE
jgi:tripartite-type tricarboxylate transporter receptor subunit TctC